MKGKARIIEADRSQLSWDLIDLDAWLPEDHLARVIWAFTGTLDLSPLYAPIKSVEGEAGRPAIEPRVLLALWHALTHNLMTAIRLNAVTINGMAAA